MTFLREHGPRYGYHPEPSKSVYVCKGEDEAEARRCFAAAGITEVKFRRGARYLGSYVGSGEQKEEWVAEKVSEWVGCVRVLAAMAPKYPQAVYTGYSLCLQAEWQYLCRVTPDIAHLLKPLEAAIRNKLTVFYSELLQFKIEYRLTLYFTGVKLLKLAVDWDWIFFFVETQNLSLYS